MGSGLDVLLTPFPGRGYGVDGAYVRPVPTDRNGPGEPREFTQGYPGGCRAWLLVKSGCYAIFFSSTGASPRSAAETLQSGEHALDMGLRRSPLGYGVLTYGQNIGATALL